MFARKCGKTIFRLNSTFNMDANYEMVEPATPVLSCDSVSYCRTEDSGYHTFTPGSIDCSELSTENIDPAVIQASICEGIANHHKLYKNTPKPCHDLSNISENNENLPDRLQRRGIKRPYQNDMEANESCGSLPTPTSLIAGQIQKLRVNESGNFSNYSISPISPEYSDASSIYNFSAYALSFPSTPIKKICKSSCKLNRLKSNHKSSPLRSINNINQPPRKFARQLDFETHSLSCEPQSLQAVTHLPPSPAAGPVLYKPNQKIDIIKLLSKTLRCIPAIEHILSFMSPVDIFNFTLVSPAWHQVCIDVPKGREKLKAYLRLSKENQENKRSTPKVNSDIRRKLKDIHNIEHVQTAASSPKSPPTSPRSMRFKMFARSATLEMCIQLACVRCQQPAKVTKDPVTGEVWAACMRATCGYQFCKHCSCDRHPGKSCIRFDLEGPSPSKRKKKTCAAGSRQSKTNLRRLLIK